MAVALSPDIAARLPEGFQEFLDRLVAEFDPDRVILFGSRARGEATEDSDTDVLVVMPCEGPPIRQAVRLRLALRPRFAMDLVVTPREKYHSALTPSDPFEFLPRVITEGIELYARL